MSVPRRALTALEAAARAAGYAVPPGPAAPDRVDDARFDATWLALRARGAHEDVVLALAEALPLGPVSPLDLAALTARDVGEGLGALALGWWLVAAEGEWLDVRHRATGTEIAIRHGSRASEDPVTDAFGLAAIVARLRAHAAGPIAIAGVALAIAPPEARRARFARFFGAPVAFGAASRVVLAPGAARTPLRTADPEIHATLRARLAAPRDLALAELRAELRRHLATGATLRAIARALGRSERVLQRALAASRTTFRALRDAVRADEARHLVAATAEPLAGVAARLGFADQASFTRAFSRWTGRSPRAFRAAARAAR